MEFLNNQSKSDETELSWLIRCIASPIKGATLN
jgi:hypothetical protein